MAHLDNPFPGMNPFLELRWSDAHTRLIAYIGDALSEELPGDLSVRAEEQVVVEGAGEHQGDRVYRADLAIRGYGSGEIPALWKGEGGGASVAVADPVVVIAEPLVERWLEIRDRDGHLVTAIELLSPHNKTGEGRTTYLEKRRHYLASTANLVEIDLIRAGRHTVAVAPKVLGPPVEGSHSFICVSRAGNERRFEVYRIPYRDRLPAFRVPLRSTDPDVPLDLQPLLDRCYRTGRYWQLSDPRRIAEGFTEDERRWITERIVKES
jgi:hypothetical protein